MEGKKNKRKVGDAGRRKKKGGLFVIIRRRTHKRAHTHTGSYRPALSLSSPPASSASACPLRLPGFLCGAPECRTLRRSAGRCAPGPPPPACAGRWNCSGRSTGNRLYCCQIPVRQTAESESAFSLLTVAPFECGDCRVLPRNFFACDFFSFFFLAASNGFLSDLHTTAAASSIGLPVPLDEA